MKGHAMISVDPDIYPLFISKFRGRASYILMQHVRDMLNLPDPLIDGSNKNQIDDELDANIKKLNEYRVIVKSLQLQKIDIEKAQEEKRIIDNKTTENMMKIQSQDFELWNQLDPYDQSKIKIERDRAIKKKEIAPETTDLEFFNIYKKKTEEQNDGQTIP